MNSVFFSHATMTADVRSDNTASTSYFINCVVSVVQKDDGWTKRGCQSIGVRGFLKMHACKIRVWQPVHLVVGVAGKRNALQGISEM